ncbi:sigma-70 family RNA polymerase sigma factor [Marinomonas sp.]|uniref:sigma-70 family RNA polymerase sigma factor n=1 Tax=Marinomonas sp. TaxID=1904862 RepID=UPI003A903965
MNRDTQVELTQLYIDHKGWLSHFLKKRLNGSHQAADMVQDIYLKILVNGKIPPKDYARQYLVSAAKNLIIDRNRRWRIEQAYLESIRNLPEETHDSPEYRLQIIETLIEVDVLLHKLTEKARQAFLLRRVEGLSYKVIAEQLDISLSSVEKYVAKGLQACAMAMMESDL